MDPARATPAETAAWLARNAVDSLPGGGLERKLAEARRARRPLRVKLGIDPTAPDIHLGFTVVLGKLREFQDLGHTVVLIVGDYTARVGDPSGRSATRPVLSGEQIDANAATFQQQALKVLDADRLEVRRNGEWLDMAMEDLFRLVRTTTVARILERDDFAKRYAAHAPISLLELLYPLLQGYDSVAVRADVELGGTDQTFNLLLGRDIQTAYGQPEQAILTMPILPGIDGERKMSKSYGNYIGVTEPPEEIYGKTLRLPDEAMGQWYELLLGEPLPPSDPAAAAAAAAAAVLSPRDAKRALARRLVARFHDEASAEAAEASFDRVHREHKPPDDMPEVALPLNGAGAVASEAAGDPSDRASGDASDRASGDASDRAAGDGPDRAAGDASDSAAGTGADTVHLPALLAVAFGVSRSEARRSLEQGGVRLDGEPLPAAPLDRPAAELDGRVLQLGKRRFARLRRV